MAVTDRSHTEEDSDSVDAGGGGEFVPDQVLARNAGGVGAGYRLRRVDLRMRLCT